MAAGGDTAAAARDAEEAERLGSTGHEAGLTRCAIVTYWLWHISYTTYWLWHISYDMLVMKPASLGAPFGSARHLPYRDSLGIPPTGAASLALVSLPRFEDLCIGLPNLYIGAASLALVSLPLFEDLSTETGLRSVNVDSVMVVRAAHTIFLARHYFFFCLHQPCRWGLFGTVGPLG